MQDSIPPPLQKTDAIREVLAISSQAVLACVEGPLPEIRTVRAHEVERDDRDAVSLAGAEFALK